MKNESLLRCRNAYISVVSELHDVLLDMLAKDELTHEQLKKLLPSIDRANELLNKDLNSF